MRLVFVSNLFPSEEEPIRGLDNATVLRELRNGFDVECRVISPRPSMPFRSPAFHPRKQDAEFAPSFPSVPYVPLFGSRFNANLMARALKPSFRSLLDSFRPDVILSSWLFPDGCAVARRCAEFDLPLVLVAQGTDVHGYLENVHRRRQILHAVEQSRFVICRSGDLSRRLTEAGADRGKPRVIYNGIDTQCFFPRPKSEARSDLGVATEEKLLLFVGNFLPVKAPLALVRVHGEVCREFRSRGDQAPRLVMIGDGPLRQEIVRETRRQGTEDRVLLPGRIPPEGVATWMQAADLLCLTSLNEGFPNVILEAMACGLFVISTDVGGIHEKLDGTKGCLVPPSDEEGFQEIIVERLMQITDSRAASGVDKAANYSWATTATAYKETLDAACWE